MCEDLEDQRLYRNPEGNGIESFCSTRLRLKWPKRVVIEGTNQRLLPFTGLPPQWARWDHYPGRYDHVRTVVLLTIDLNENIAKTPQPKDNWMFNSCDEWILHRREWDLLKQPFQRYRFQDSKLRLNILPEAVPATAGLLWCLRPKIQMGARR